MSNFENFLPRVFRTGRQIGQAVKNVHRLRTIVGVLGKYGFADIADRMNLGPYLPGRLRTIAKDLGDLSTAARLRLSFEELGPTFVKLGQLLSTRSDLFPESFIQEFAKLQDSAPSLPFELMRGVIESELKTPITQAFESVNETPLAAASIAQVHEARLKTGELVVLKIQRPDIKRVVDQDLSILMFLAKLLEKYVPESRLVNPSLIVDEFFKTLSHELDFRIEANNMTKMSENFRSIEEIVIPKVYRELSSERLLVQEKLQGIRVTDTQALDRAGIDRKKVVRIGARAFFKSVMVDGLFHGDLHAGNLFVLPGDKLGIIDFGIVGRLSERARDQLAVMLTALLTEDFETLGYTYAELGAADPSIDFEAFQRELRNTVSPYMGLNLSQVNSGKVMLEATRVATRFQIRIPGDWMQVFKALLTTEGMGRALDPEFDMLEIGQDMVKELIKSQFSVGRMAREINFVSREALALARVLPRQLRWMFRKFNRDDFAFEIKSKDLRILAERVDASGQRISLGVLASGLLVSGSIAMQYSSDSQVAGYPLVSMILMALGALVLLRLAFGRK